MTYSDNDWCDWCAAEIPAGALRRSADRVFCSNKCLAAYHARPEPPTPIEPSEPGK